VDRTGDVERPGRALESRRIVALEPRRIVTAARTDPGRVRGANQDHCAEFEADDAARLLVVADGMGGHANGDVASRIAVETIGEVFRGSRAAPEALLYEAFSAANDRVHELGAHEPLGMGTTAVALLLRPEGAWVAHVGDSRAYRWREGRLQRLTEDHSWVFQEVAHGRMTPSEAAAHPRRNALLRSIGMQDEGPAEVQTVEAAPGDRFLLCSDGLWDELDEAALGGVLASAEPAESVARLIELANRAGGHDNVTAAVARIPDPAPPIRPRTLWIVVGALAALAGVARWCGT
jgi:protein phosphatase